MEVKKEAIGITASILLALPLLGGGFWVIKSLADQPVETVAGETSTKSLEEEVSEVIEHDFNYKEIVVSYDEKIEEFNVDVNGRNINEIIDNELEDDEEILIAEDPVVSNDRVEGSKSSQPTNDRNIDAGTDNDIANKTPVKSNDNKESNVKSHDNKVEKDPIKQEKSTTTPEENNGTEEKVQDNLSDQSTTDEPGETEELSPPSEEDTNSNEEEDNSGSQPPSGEKAPLQAVQIQ